ncbi:hypothetical protein C4D60_Mb05t04230 [Musa balbisiana]|uniref:DNA-directed primase/polymerase protein n=1 Tax=Musa balbisiana TaxID=52838 RepID=A0A4S8JTK3_MUSBA|nr:hypothetical protein C4D60_Mb05t04230 [Musa balbisiana]
MACDPKDDVDRLFACFKCGISTPESAIRERRLHPETSKKAGLVRGKASTVVGIATSSLSEQCGQDSAGKENLGACTSVAIKLKSGKQISPIVFYGSPHGAPIKRPSRLLRLLHEIRIDLKEDNDLILREELWTTFPRQEEAIRFLKAHAQAKLFSYQDHLSGQRRFLVSTYSEFWRRYRCMDPKLRHHYEVIKEIFCSVLPTTGVTGLVAGPLKKKCSEKCIASSHGPVLLAWLIGLPCHLYFDLEFDKTVNAGKNVDDMVDILMSMTFDILFDKYAIEANDGWIIELDSSTTKKFSRHVIIRIPKVAFKDNSHVGAFVSEVCSRITSQRGSDPQLDKLYVRKDSSSSDFQLFLDSAVYSRNRCFRLVFSSKAGKNSFLLPTGRFKCKDMTEQEVFMESLICRMDSDCNKLLKCQIDIDCKKTLYFDFECAAVQQQTSDALQHTALNAYRSDFPSTYSSGKSPFPALDAFVEFIASSGNVKYEVVHDGAIGEEARRFLANGHEVGVGGWGCGVDDVMYIADLHRAIYYQKCYDPDCKGYRSPLRPLPHDVIPSDILLFDSTQRINYREDLDTNFGLELDGSHMEHYSCDGDELVTDSCNMESSWWQEAMTYADRIENMKNAPEFKISQNEENAVDCSWWMDVEKLASQVEGQLGTRRVTTIRSCLNKMMDIDHAEHEGMDIVYVIPLHLVALREETPSCRRRRAALFRLTLGFSLKSKSNPDIGSLGILMSGQNHVSASGCVIQIARVPSLLAAPYGVSCCGGLATANIQREAKRAEGRWDHFSATGPPTTPTTSANSAPPIPPPNPLNLRLQLIILLITGLFHHQTKVSYSSGAENSQDLDDTFNRIGVSKGKTFNLWDSVGQE